MCLIVSLVFPCCFQVIQTISAVDKDEPLGGHRFYFALAAPAAGNLNFTLRDNKGISLVILWLFSVEVVICKLKASAGCEKSWKASSKFNLVLKMFPQLCYVLSCFIFDWGLYIQTKRGAPVITIRLWALTAIVHDAVAKKLIVAEWANVDFRPTRFSSSLNWFGPSWLSLENDSCSWVLSSLGCQILMLLLGVRPKLSTQSASLCQ